MRPPHLNRKGQGLVEFALVVPILLLLVIGIIEFGRAWMTRNILTGAAREAVRMAVVQKDFPAADNVAQARANEVMSAVGITGASIMVTPVDTPEPLITVQIDYQFPVLIAGFIPGLGNSTFPLSTTTTMRRERF